MNREKAKALLPIITAFAEGKEVQVNSGTKEHPTWFTRTDLCFDWTVENYRVKPEPREVWIIYNRDGRKVSDYSDKTSAQESLERLQLMGYASPYTLAKFVEQL